MSSQNQRINKGITSLVRRLLGDIPGEDPAAAEERESNAVEFVGEFLERYNVFHTIIFPASDTSDASARTVREVQQLSQM